MRTSPIGKKKISPAFGKAGQLKIPDWARVGSQGGSWGYVKQLYIALMLCKENGKIFTYGVRYVKQMLDFLS